MLKGSAQRGMCRRDRRRQAPSSIPKELAMHIGEEQQEFEILPTEQEQQPLVIPEHEPPLQPEETSA
jgi:hypothetical protein